MTNSRFHFKSFSIEQEGVGMKVTTDACLFGAWVANQIAKSHPSDLKILDIGTGTGLLSLMVAQKYPLAQIHAVEIESNAATIAKTNFENSMWQKRLHLHLTSIQQYNPDSLFDIIISNPPFFSSSKTGENKNKNIALHATELGQASLLDSVKRLMHANGSFYVLYPEREMKQFTNLCLQENLSPVATVAIKQKTNAPNFRQIIHFKQRKPIHSALQSEVIIKNAEEKYTKEFWSLLKDYYLEYNNPSIT